jgi:protein-histidine pros-kinase
LKEIRAEVQDLLADLRQVCAELRPPMLDTLGLSAALRALADDWSTQKGIAIQLDLPAGAAPRSLPGDVAVNLYRVAQEALSNVARHAQAQHVTIALRQDIDCVALMLQDDGRGFAVPGVLHDLIAHGHYGLIGMQERVDLINGQLTLASSPNQGTSVSVIWRRSEQTIG